MSLLSASLIEFLVKGIPEGFLFAWAMFVFTRTKMDKKKYILISLTSSITTFAIRLLPINYGVNTMLSLLVLIILFISICKVDITKVILSALGVTIILFISEELNILLLRSIFGTEKTIALLTSTMGKTIYGIPSTFFFALILLIAKVIIRKKDGKDQAVDKTDTQKKRD